MGFNDIDAIDAPKTLSYLQRCMCTRISMVYSPLPLVDFLSSVPTLIPVDPRPNDLSIILYRELQPLSLLIKGLQQKPKIVHYFFPC